MCSQARTHDGSDDDDDNDGVVQHGGHTPANLFIYLFSFHCDYRTKIVCNIKKY